MHGPKKAEPFQTMYVAVCVCVSVTSHHEVWLCEDPPELLGLHVLWVT